MRQLKSTFSLLIAAVMIMFGMVGPASAEVPESVTDAITAAVADVGTVGAAILGVIIAIVAFSWIRRVLK